MQFTCACVCFYKNREFELLNKRFIHSLAAIETNRFIRRQSAPRAAIENLNLVFARIVVHTGQSEILRNGGEATEEEEQKRRLKLAGRLFIDISALLIDVTRRGNIVFGRV